MKVESVSTWFVISGAYFCKMKGMKNPYNQSYSSPRLTIRSYKLKDYSAWHQGMISRGPPTDKFDSGPLPLQYLSKQAFRFRVSAYNEAAEKDEAYNFGIFEKRSDQHIGNISLYLLQRNPMQWANIGYQIHNHKRGNGYAKEAAKLILKIAFESFGLQRVEAVMEKDHKASIAIAIAAGMTKECIRKRFLPTEKGEWVDAVVYSTVK